MTISVTKILIGFDKWMKVSAGVSDNQCISMDVTAHSQRKAPRLFYLQWNFCFI